MLFYKFRFLFQDFRISILDEDGIMVGENFKVKMEVMKFCE